MELYDPTRHRNNCYFFIYLVLVSNEGERILRTQKRRNVLNPPTVFVIVFNQVIKSRHKGKTINKEGKRRKTNMYLIYTAQTVTDQNPVLI